jgi:glycosyltransferase 2 family protein
MTHVDPTARNLVGTQVLMSRLKSLMSWRKLAGLGVSVGLFLVILGRLDLPVLVGTLLRVRLGWGLLAVGAFGSACLLGAWRWRVMLGLRSLHPSPWLVVTTGLAGHFLNTLLMGPAAGDVAKSFFFSRWHRSPVADVLASCWLDRMAAGIGSVLFALLLMPWVDWRAIPPVKWHMQFRLWHVLILLAITAGGLWLWRRTWRGKKLIKDSFRAWVIGVKNLVRSPRSALLAVSLGLLVQVLLSSVLVLSLRAITQSDIVWAQVFWAFPIISLITALPISIAGVGVREGAAVVLLGWFGIVASEAVAASLITLACNLIWAAVGGCVLFWSEALVQPVAGDDFPKKPQ